MGKIARLCIFGVLAFSFVMAPARPARANIVTDIQQIAEMVAEWAITAEQYILEAQDWLTKNVTLNSIAPSIMSGIGIQTQAQVLMTQAQVDGMRQAHTADAVGNIAQATNMGESSIICATEKGYQAYDSAMDVATNMGRASQTFEQGVSAGPNASGAGTVAASEEVNDLCALGFLMKQGQNPATSRYSSLVTTKNCQDPSGTGKYLDADMRISSVIDALQYPLPAHDHVSFTGDGHICFRGSGGANKPCTGGNNAQADPNEAVAGLGSEMDFVAAYKFCEHLLPGVAPPTVNSGTPTAADNVNIKNDRDFESLRTAAADECFRALWYRTSCPTASESTMKNISGANGPDCTKVQLQMCSRLVWPAPNGLGLTFGGDNPRFASALKNCSDAVGNNPNVPLPSPPPQGFQGLSPAMYDAMIAKKCHDATYIGVISKDKANAAGVEQMVQFDCPDEEAFYGSRMDNERERLEIAIQNLIQMRGMGAGTSQTTRISK